MAMLADRGNALDYLENNRDFQRLNEVLRKHSGDFAEQWVKQCFECVRGELLASEYNLLDLDDYSNRVDLYHAVQAICKHDYQEMHALWSRSMVVSLTSYPQRVHCVPQVLDTLFSQSLSPELIVLYLAETEFPRKESDLPKQLLSYRGKGRFQIRWCEQNIKAHKKYYFAFRDFPEHVLVTVDDDLLYRPTMLENLWMSYLQFPEAVSTARAHLITFDDKNGQPYPYSFWVKEIDSIPCRASNQLMATGGAGALYPPKREWEPFLRQDVIEAVCPLADDIWLKVMEASTATQVVVSEHFTGLRYVPHSQDTGLRYVNVDENFNDEQLARARGWTRDQFGRDLLSEFLLSGLEDLGLAGGALFCEQHAIKNDALREHIRELSAKLQRTYDEKAEINAKLQRTYDEKAERGIKVKELSCQNARLEKKISNLREKNAKLKREKTRLAKRIYRIESSRTYRFCKMIAKPYRLFKKFVRQLF